jgi:hypothetical protein
LTIWHVLESVLAVLGGVYSCATGILAAWVIRRGREIRAARSRTWTLSDPDGAAVDVILREWAAEGDPGPC